MACADVTDQDRRDARRSRRLQVVSQTERCRVWIREFPTSPPLSVRPMIGLAEGRSQ